MSVSCDDYLLLIQLFHMKGVICLKVVWVGGSHTSILTPYLKSTGLFTPRVKFLSNSDQPLQRYSNIPAHCNVGTENLNLGNPSVLMIYSSEVTPAAWHICYNINFKHNF